MRYKPELGFFGNLERAFSELAKTNNNVFNTENRVSDTENTANNTKGVVTAQLGEETLQNAEQFRRAVQMFAASLSDKKAMEIATIYDHWVADRKYNVGDFLTYGTNSVGDPQLYRVVQAHTSQLDWLPDTASTLYVKIGLDEQGYPVWSKPSGAHDAYNKGDIVDYNGKLYESLIDGNIYSPDEYPAGWQEVAN